MNNDEKVVQLRAMSDTTRLVDLLSRIRVAMLMVQGKGLKVSLVPSADDVRRVSDYAHALGFAEGAAQAIVSMIDAECPHVKAKVN